MPILAAALAALFVVGGAQAVHQLPDSSFQLDRNATTETETPQRDDWANVFAGNDSASVSTGIINDPFGETIFTGGSTKDDLDLSGWQHKSGSVPPKDEISDSFAALYNVSGELRLYFGADRFANNGSSQIGFWFFQSTVCRKSDGTFGNTLTGTTCSGTAAHTAGSVPHDDANPGDILILSDFTQGGAISTIRVFEWVGSGGSDGAVNQIAAGVDCIGATHPPDLCGTVNNADTPSPWPYTPKFGTPGIFPPGSLYEGGVDLTAFGFENVCFSSFLAETRSSPSVDATLKDFVLGSFPTCEANIVTTPSSSEVFPGEQVRDAATITGSGPTAPAPQGTVSFFLCAKDVSPCATDGTPVGTVDLTGNTDNPVTVFSNFVNTAASPLEPGSYCFAAEWTNDPVYNDDSDRTTGECFTVSTIPSVTITTPVDGSGTPIGSITLGDSIFDKAVVMGTAAGGDPTGTVTFFICGPIAVGTCSSGGTQVGSPVPLVSDGDPTTFTSSATSDAVTPSAVGRYCFRGEYSGSNFYDPSSDSTEVECFIVTTTSSTSSAQVWLPNDSATVSSAGNLTNLDGTLSFTLHEGSDCTGAVLRPAQTFTFANLSSPQTRETTNSTVTVSGAGLHTVSWEVVFDSTNPLVADSNKCETTSLTIDNG